MFTQPCFIRKYSKELCEKLEYLGLDLLNSGGTTLDCHNYDGKGHHRMIDEGRAIITYQSSHYGVIYDIDDVTKWGRIDCGTNEELFLAIAALRDDSDYMQYFKAAEDDKLLLCKDKHIEEYTTWHELYWKATPQELIEYFKEK